MYERKGGAAGNSSTIEVGDSEDDEESSDEEDGSESEESEEEEEELSKTAAKDARKALRALKKHLEDAQQILTSHREQGKTQYLVKFRGATFKMLECARARMCRWKDPDMRSRRLLCKHNSFDLFVRHSCTGL